MVGQDEIYKKNVRDAWIDYVQNGEDARGKVRSSIVNSWERCWDMQAWPWQESPRRQLKRTAFKQLLAAKQSLIDLSTPYMESLYRQVQNTGCIIGLTDESGIILKEIGDKDLHEQMRWTGFKESVDWSEWSAGTNAIGTALVLEQVMQVSAAEHYCHGFLAYTSTSSPIWDENGSIVGTICMFGYEHSANHHTLAMVLSTANAINSQLKMLSAQRETKFFASYNSAIIDCVHQAMLTIDIQGRITMINHSAIQLLCLPSNDVCVGSLITDILPQENAELMDIVFDHRKITDKEITVRTRGGEELCSVTTRIIDSDEKEIGGIVLVLDVIKRIRKSVHPSVGMIASKNFEDLAGKNPKFLEQILIAKNAALSDANVLLLGESGTGKDVFAQAIHNHSMRRRGPFVAINCSAIPRELIGSELFGYVDGAYTGAKRGGSAGKFEFADSGTIFLDEIGDMPLDLQGHLLRVIEDRTVLRIGGHDAIPVDVRIIAATNHSLQEDVKRKLFRQDLFYRLNVITLRMLPLRERMEDLEEMILLFYKKLVNNPNPPSNPIAQSYIQALQNYDFPGNIRELQNIVERSITMFPNRILDSTCLPYEELFNQKTRTAPFGERNRDYYEERIDSPEDRMGYFEETTEFHGRPEAYQSDKEMVYHLLLKNGGNISKTAQEMGVARTTLYRKMDRYGFAKTILR